MLHVLGPKKRLHKNRIMLIDAFKDNRIFQCLLDKKNDTPLTEWILNLGMMKTR